MPPVLVLTPALLPDVLVVVPMLVVEVFLLTQILPRRGPPPPLARMVIGSSALLGSAATLMALVQAFLVANLDSYTLVVFSFNFMMLAPPGLWVIAVIVFRDRTVDPRSWFWPVAITAMATSAELLMGLLFTVEGGSALDLPAVLAGTLTSAWYLWSMAGAMFALLWWIPVAASLRAPLLGLAASGIAAPWVVADATVGALLMAAVMAGTVALLYRSAARWSPSDLRHLGPVRAILLAFLAMTLAGLAVAVTTGGVAAVLAFGAVMTVVMVGEFLYVVREGLTARSSTGAPVPEPPRAVPA